MEKKFTLLTLDQVEGDKKLEIFDEYGIDAEATGYAIKRGATPFTLKGKYYAAHGINPEGHLLDKKCCEYWTSTKASGTWGQAYSVGKMEVNAESSMDYENGIRLVVPYEAIKDEITSESTIHGKNKDIKVVTYGEYPQTTVPTEEKYRLLKLYENGTMKPTGKSYGAEGCKVTAYYDGTDIKYEEDNYKEYELNGEKYVLAKNHLCAPTEEEEKRYFFAKVEPIEWLVDEKSGLAVSKKCLVGGIPLKRNGLYNGNINKTRIQNFIDNDMAFDMAPPKKELNKNDNLDKLFENEQIEIAEPKKSLIK